MTPAGRNSSSCRHARTHDAINNIADISERIAINTDRMAVAEEEFGHS